MRMLRITFSVSEDQAGPIIADLAGRVQIEEIGAVRAITYSKKRTPEERAAGDAEDARVTEMRREHHKNVRDSIAAAILSLLQAQGGKTSAGELRAGAKGPASIYVFNSVMDQLIGDGKVRRIDTGKAGPHKYLYALGRTSKAMSDEERKAKDRERKQAARDAAKPKRDYKAERAKAKAKKLLATIDEAKAQAEGAAA